METESKTPRADYWSRASTLAAILVPAAIALAGHLIAQGLKQAEIQSEDRRAEQTRLLTEANIRVAQANLINTLMGSLTSEKPQERRLAVEAVLIALPEQGQALARTVAQFDVDKTVQSSARNSLQQRVDGLIRDIFAEDAPTRKSAVAELLRGWRSDSTALDALLLQASRSPDNSNGIYNTAFVLGQLDRNVLLGQRRAVEEFLNIARATGAKTGQLADAVARRLAGQFETGQG